MREPDPYDGEPDQILCDHSVHFFHDASFADWYSEALLVAQAANLAHDLREAGFHADTVPDVGGVRVYANLLAA